MALVETRTEDGVGVITINRPDALNAVNSEVMEGLLSAAAAFDADPEIGCILITGEGKVFIAGADIKEMQEKSYMDMFMADVQAGWEAFAATRTPMIAAVNGFALGGQNCAAPGNDRLHIFGKNIDFVERKWNTFRQIK